MQAKGGKGGDIVITNPDGESVVVIKGEEPTGIFGGKGATLESDYEIDIVSLSEKGEDVVDKLRGVSPIEAFEICLKKFGMTNKDFNKRAVTIGKRSGSFIEYSKVAAEHANLQISPFKDKLQIWYVDIPPWMVEVLSPSQKLFSPYRYHEWSNIIIAQSSRVSWKRLRNSVSSYAAVRETKNGKWECFLIYEKNIYELKSEYSLCKKKTIKEAQNYLDNLINIKYKSCFLEFETVYNEIAQEYGLRWSRENSPIGSKNHAALIGSEIILYEFDDPEKELLAYFHEFGHYLSNQEFGSMHFSISMNESRAWTLGLQKLYKLGYRWDVYHDEPFKWAFEAFSSYYFCEADILLFSNEKLNENLKIIKQEINRRKKK